MEDRSENSRQNKNLQKKKMQKKNMHGKDLHKREHDRKGIHKKEFYKKDAHRKASDQKDCRRNGSPENKAPKKEIPEEWLYLAKEGDSLGDLYQHLKGEKRWSAEYWEEAEVLEIRIPEAGSVDLEAMETDPEDHALRSYMEETGAKTAYAVTVMPEYFEKAQAVMQYIADKTGGIFCGDTEDFQPEIREASGNSQRPIQKYRQG